MNANSSLEETDILTICGYYEGYSLSRFASIATASVFSVFGIVANIFLAFVFLTTKEQVTSVLYLTVLSLLDSALCCGYLLLIGTDAIYHYLESTTLFRLWHWYIRPVFGSTKIVQLCIPFMLILATVERYLFWNEQRHKNKTARRVGIPSAIVSLTTRYRGGVALAVCLICVLLRVPDFFAFEVNPLPNCTARFRNLEFAPNAFSETAFYTFYSLYFMTIIQVFIPFIILTVLNTIILRKMMLSATPSKKSLTFHDSSLRADTTARILTDSPPVSSPALVSFATKNGDVTGSFSHHRHPGEAPTKGDHDSLPLPLYSNGGVSRTLTNTAGGDCPPAVDTPLLQQQRQRQVAAARSYTQIHDDNEERASTPPKTAEQMPENFVMMSITAKLLQERLVSSTPASRSKKRQVRSAINTMLVIVTSHLICNSLQIALVVLERTDTKLLYSAEDDRISSAFYTTLSDLVSFLYMFCSAMRVVVYFTTNLEIRKDIRRACCCLRRSNAAAVAV